MDKPDIIRNIKKKKTTGLGDGSEDKHLLGNCDDWNSSPPDPCENPVDMMTHVQSPCLGGREYSGRQAG